MKIIFFILAIAVCYANGIKFQETISTNDGSRISDGNLAAESQFPYSASIQQVLTVVPQPTPSPTRNHRCGGVLITLQHVLTAASCLFNNVNGTPVAIDPVNFRVFAGSVGLGNDGNDRVRNIANYTIAPGFLAAPAYINDIAIVTLIQPFVASVTLAPLALPSADFEPEDSTLCTVAGWGSSAPAAFPNPPTPSPSLRFATKYVYNQNLCTFLYNTVPDAPNIFNTMICAASFDIISSGCTGDAGNALVCNNTLTGILFGYTGCDVTNSFPELYTRISNYTVWIRSISGAGYPFASILPLLVAAVVVQMVVSKIVS